MSGPRVWVSMREVLHFMENIRACAGGISGRLRAHRLEMEGDGGRMIWTVEATLKARWLTTLTTL